MASLKHDPQGYTHIADDGVARSYDANHQVIDYAPLSNAQILGYMSQLPTSYDSELDHLHSVFDNVDGHDVTDKDQLLDPPTWLKPPAISLASESTQSTALERAPILEGRDNFCRGQPCSSSAACQFLGCSYCGMLDAVLPGGGGVCI
jgi:hypothetical protein